MVGVFGTFSDFLASPASLGPADRNSLPGQNPSALSTETACPASQRLQNPSALPTETAFPVRISRPCRQKQHSRSESLGPADRNSMPGLTAASKQPGTSSTLRSEAARYVVYATVRNSPVRRLRDGQNQKQPGTSSTLRSETARYVVYATVRISQNPSALSTETACLASQMHRSSPVRRLRYGQKHLGTSSTPRSESTNEQCLRGH